jgi:prepilin-type N-terminal cleavage/methylation domain-containing protein
MPLLTSVDESLVSTDAHANQSVHSIFHLEQGKLLGSVQAVQSGFSLIEMSIVLVIVGVLLGGILKGQSMIEASRIKSTLNDINALSSAYYAYEDRYHQLAGDDGSLTSLQARGGQWATVSLAGDLNGVWDISAGNTFAGTGESGAFFQHLRAAGFMQGNVTETGVAALPRHAFGGLIGVTANAVTGMPTNSRYVCLGSLTGSMARSIDIAKDDGVANTGNIRSTQGGNNTIPSTSATAYSDTENYTLCMGL